MFNLRRNKKTKTKEIVKQGKSNGKAILEKTSSLLETAKSRLQSSYTKTKQSISKVKKETWIRAGIVVTGFAVLAVLGYMAIIHNTNPNLVTMKGEAITQKAYYDQVKKTQSGQETMMTMTINAALEQLYGKDIDEKDVDAEYEKNKVQYGNQFESLLQQAGLTEETYKDQIRSQKLLEVAVRKRVEKTTTNDDYAKLYETYIPETQAQIIMMSDKTKAEEVLQKAQAGEDFSKLAQENSGDTATKTSGGLVTFDSTSSSVPDEVKNAAAALTEGQVSNQLVVVTTGQSAQGTASETYYIVKTTKSGKKSDNWQDDKSKLIQLLTQQKLQDSDYMSQVIAQVLKDANVIVKDEAFKTLFDKYANPEQSSNTATQIQ